MNSKKFINKIIIGLWLTCFMALGHAGKPLWTITPLTKTTITVVANDTAIVSYRITNQSRKIHALAMKVIPGVTQITTAGNCPTSFVLGYQEWCDLNLLINGSSLDGSVIGGPIVCNQHNSNQCYQPSAENVLSIKKIQSLCDTNLCMEKLAVFDGEKSTFDLTSRSKIMNKISSMNAPKHLILPFAYPSYL